MVNIKMKNKVKLIQIIGILLVVNSCKNHVMVDRINYELISIYSDSFWVDTIPYFPNLDNSVFVMRDPDDNVIQKGKFFGSFKKSEWEYGVVVNDSLFSRLTNWVNYKKDSINMYHISEFVPEKSVNGDTLVKFFNDDCVCYLAKVDLIKTTKHLNNFCNGVYSGGAKFGTYDKKIVFYYYVIESDIITHLFNFIYNGVVYEYLIQFRVNGKSDIYLSNILAVESVRNVGINNVNFFSYFSSNPFVEKIKCH